MSVGTFAQLLVLFGGLGLLLVTLGMMWGDTLVSEGLCLAYAGLLLTGTLALVSLGPLASAWWAARLGLRPGRHGYEGHVDGVRLRLALDGRGLRASPAPASIELVAPAETGIACGGVRVAATGDPLLLAAALTPDVRARLHALARGGPLVVSGGEAAWTLGLGAPRLPLLAAVLRDLHVPVGERVARAWRVLDDPSADPDLRELALAGLLKSSEAEKAAAYVDLERGPTRLVAVAAAWLLDRQPPADDGARAAATDALLRSLGHLAASDDVNDQARAMALVDVPPANPRAPILRAHLATLRRAARAVPVRLAMVRAIARLGGSEAPSWLLDVIREGGTEERELACRVVGELAEPSDPVVCAALLGVLHDERAEGVVAAAAGALGRIGGPAELTSLRARRGEAVERAIAAILLRTGAGSGRVAVAGETGGEVAAVEGGAVAIAEDRKGPPRGS